MRVGFEEGSKVVVGLKLLVGEFEGLTVGGSEGDLEGNGVVGFGVGFRDGRSVGLYDGELDGLCVGKRVGEMDGLFVGMKLGLFVGTWLGLVLGDLVGSRLVTPTTDTFLKGTSRSIYSNSEAGLFGSTTSSSDGSDLFGLLSSVKTVVMSLTNEKTRSSPLKKRST